jgi:hypothetical protein
MMIVHVDSQHITILYINEMCYGKDKTALALQGGEPSASRSIHCILGEESPVPANRRLCDILTRSGRGNTIYPIPLLGIEPLSYIP